MLDAVETRSNCLDKMRERRVDRDDPRAGMIDDVFDLLRLESKIYGYDDRAKLRDSVVKLEETMAVEREQGNPVTTADTELRQSSGKAIDSLIHLTKV